MDTSTHNMRNHTTVPTTTHLHRPPPSAANRGLTATGIAAVAILLSLYPTLAVVLSAVVLGLALLSTGPVALVGGLLALGARRDHAARRVDPRSTVLRSLRGSYARLDRIRGTRDPEPTG